VSVDGVADPSLQRSECFLAGLALVAFAVVEDPAPSVLLATEPIAGSWWPIFPDAG